MVIMSLDVGKKQGAIVIYDTEKKLYLVKQTWAFNSLLVTYRYLKILMVSHAVDLVVIGEAFGQRVVVKVHSKFYGVVELLTEDYNRTVYYLSDTTARMVVLGKGNGRRKDLVQEKYKEETPDLSDACLFISAYLIQTEGRDESFGAKTKKSRGFPETD